MNIWHKRFLYLQIMIMSVLAIILWFSPDKEYLVVPGTTLFLILQIMAVGAKGNENPHAVFYKPSCVVALIDAISKFIFVAISVLYLIIKIDNGFFWVNPIALGFLFLYIAIRKFYIIKNYSYEI